VTAPSPRPALLERARRVADGPARAHAATVDRDARFPAETVEALKRERLLGVAVPSALGGEDATLEELSAICQILGEACASSAMVYAMHQIQLLCLVRHGAAGAHTDGYFARTLRACSERQLLIASATSEVGVGGDTRSSRCALEADDKSFRLHKEASVVSYGQHCDAILVTARRSPDAVASDQSIALVERGQYALEQMGGWDTLGMRGTESCGFRLSARAPLEQVLPEPFERVSADTMHPVSHVLWAHVWLGIASASVATARKFVRAEARKKPGVTPPSALRAAELVSQLHVLRGSVRDAMLAYEARKDDPDALSAMSFQIRMNDLKIATAEQVVPIVLAAMALCGIAAYRNDSDYSLGRHLRDALGAGVMIGNDRLYATNAMLLLVSKDL